MKVMNTVLLDEELEYEPIDFGEILSTERIKQKRARAGKRRNDRKAKNRLRFMTMNDPDFFLKTKEEQRSLHLSPYSRKRLQWNHGIYVFEKMEKAKMLYKLEAKEITLLRKEYLGSHSSQKHESLLPTHIETLANELLEISGRKDLTLEDFVKDFELLLFYTHVFRPDMYQEVCKYVA